MLPPLRQSRRRSFLRRNAFSAAARDYFARVAAASGSVTNKPAVADYIDALVELGGAYWDTADQHCIFVGVSFEGCFVPLRDGMTAPTNNNFVSGDHSSTTGLLGNGSTKYVNSNINNNTLSQNDNALTAYVTDAYDSTANADYGIIGAGGGATGANQISLNYSSSSGGELTGFRNMTGTGDNPGSRQMAQREGLFGTSRALAANYAVINEDVDTTITRTSQTPYNGMIYVFARESAGSPGLYLPSRLAAYTISPSITLGTLRTIQDTLVASV